MKNAISLAMSMLKVGFIGFGGGSALIPVLEKEFVSNKKMETKKEYDKHVIVASLTPGALPVEVASSIGRKVLGPKGMHVGAICMALPGALLTLLMTSLLSINQEKMLNFITLFSVAVYSFILYLLYEYINKTLKECKKESDGRYFKALFLVGLVFLLACGKNVYSLLGIERKPILGVSTISILGCAFFFAFYTRSVYTKKNLIVSAIVGLIFFLGCGQSKVIKSELVHKITIVIMIALALYTFIKNRKKNNVQFQMSKRVVFKDLLAWMLFLVILCLPAVIYNAKAIVFIARGFLSSLMSFGGGDAYLTIADSLFVSTNMIDAAVYYGQVVAIVNILPGSILCKTMSAIGYFIGYGMSGSWLIGIIYGIAGFATSIAASCSCYQTVWHMYDSVDSISVVKTIGRWIRPIIAGLLLNIGLSLFKQGIKVAPMLKISKLSVVLLIILMAVMDTVLVKKFKIHQVVMLVINMGIVLGIYVLI